MALSRRAESTLVACSAVLLAGILGLAWWFWRYRRGREPPAARLRRTRAVLVALGLLVIALGATWRLVIVVKPVPECSPPGGPLPASPLSAQVVAEKAATWAETGIGILYSQATGAHICFSRAENYYVALNADHIAGARAVALGDVVLKPELDMPREDLKGLVEHEARHRTQWAVGTVAGGSAGISHRVRHYELLLPRRAQSFRAHGRPGRRLLHPVGDRAGAGSRSARRAQRPGSDHRRGSVCRALPACRG